MFWVSTLKKHRASFIALNSLLPNCTETLATQATSISKILCTSEVGTNLSWLQMIIYSKLQSSRLRHQYGIFGGESQTSFTRNATRAGSEEGQLFWQAKLLSALRQVGRTWRGQLTTGIWRNFLVIKTNLSKFCPKCDLGLSNQDRRYITGPTFMTIKLTFILTLNKRASLLSFPRVWIWRTLSLSVNVLLSSVATFCLFFLFFEN